MAIDSSFNIGKYFLPEGPLCGAVKSYEPRAQQSEMAAAVMRAIFDRKHLVVEAGTGVGKSLAYLLPCAFHAVLNEKKAVVATYTKALQDQLVQKDLPVVRRVLQQEGLELRYSLLMGSENYLCARRLQQAIKKGPLLYEHEDFTAVTEALLEWITSSDTGLRSKAPVKIQEGLWHSICREPDLCLKRHCSFREGCLHRKDIERARNSNIIVVNQALFFAGMPISPFDILVFDEAHNMEDVAMDYLGTSVSNYRVRRLLDEILNPGTGRGIAARLEKRNEKWLSAMEEAVVDARVLSEDFFATLAEKLEMRFDSFQTESRSKRVVEPDIIKEEVTRAIERIGALLTVVTQTASTKEEEVTLKAYTMRCAAVAGAIKQFLSCCEKDKVYWVETRLTRGKPFIQLNITPLDIAPLLEKSLFAGPVPVVLTSATLAVDGSFDNLKQSLGIKDCNELLLDSPFNYREQAALYVQADLPDPASQPEEFENEAIARCLKLAEAVVGGIFILFTSWQFLRKAREYITTESTGRAVFVQGAEPPEELLRDFKKAGNGILLATQTFWQGVDVPGRELSCVVITRLPFTSPGSPVEEAREEWLTSKGVDVFNSFSLPRAVIKFHQGFGRLIRNKNDIGAVAVLDPRILTRRYGRKFLNSIPKCRPVADLETLKAFFEEKNA